MTVYLGKNPVGIGRIVVKPVAKKKYGATVDSFLGDVDANGKLQKPTEFIDLYFTGVKDVGYSLAKLFQDNIRVTSVSFPDLTHLSLFAAAQYMFAGCSGLTSASLPNLTTLNYGSSGAYMFQNCTNLTSFNLNNLMTISGNNSAWYMFYGCKNLTMANLPKLKTISGSQSCDSMFQGCTGLKTVDLSSLETVNGGGSLNRMFRGCTGLTSISFPSLTTIISSAMGSSSDTGTFYQCTNLTEIHFRADAQSTIEAVSQYSSKFGATNATIYFDL